MIYNILNNENIMNATANVTANVTATAPGVGFTGAELDMLSLGFGAMILMFIAMAMD